jgi:V/A-type H+-transporting ATPase subunit B
VFEGTSKLSLNETVVRFRGEPLTLPVTKEMLGRVFDGLGRPTDGGPTPVSAEHWDVNGLPINPTSRTYPTKFIETGISAIDGMNTLVRGQKLPIFSGAGLPHNRVTAQIVRQAKIVGEDVSFAIVFAAMGVKHDVARFFIENFRPAFSKTWPSSSRSPTRPPWSASRRRERRSRSPNTWRSARTCTCSLCSPT